MPSLYLDLEGGKLRLQERQLQLHRPDGTCTSFPLEQVDRIFVIGAISMSHSALTTLLDRAVPTTWHTRRGRFRGALAIPQPAQVQRRARQYALLAEPQEALRLARHLVRAKIASQRRLLGYWRKDHDIPIPQGPLKALQRKAERASSAEQLRGVEGLAGRYCYQGLAQALAGTGFAFSTRQRRPPRDPINALLSLGYTLLLGEMRGFVEHEGLDVYASFFHVADGRQPALPLDLIEPFRVWVLQLVLELTRDGVVQPDDFTRDHRGCWLADGRRGAVYKAWETLMERPLRSAGRRSTRRRCLHDQAAAYACALTEQPPQPAFYQLR